jgi:hypothetical protein
MAVAGTVQVMARNDVTVKLDATVARKAKMIAAARDITVAEYLSEILRPIVQRDLGAESAKMLRSEDAGAPSQDSTSRKGK